MNKFLGLVLLATATVSLNAVTIKTVHNNSQQDAFLIVYDAPSALIEDSGPLLRPILIHEPAIEKIDGIIYKLTRQSIARCPSSLQSIDLPEKDFVVIATSKGPRILSGRGKDMYEIEIALDGTIIVVKNGKLFQQ